MSIIATLKAIIFTPISWFMTLLTWFIAPFLPLFAEMRDVPWANEPRPMLKGWLIIFQTYEEDLDCGHRRGKYWTIDTSSKIQVYWSRVRWIWRNPAWGFNFYLLGRNIEYPFLEYYDENEVTSIIDSKGYFCKRWRFSIFGLKLRFRWGWKFFRCNKDCDVWKGKQRSMFTCSLIGDK